MKMIVNIKKLNEAAQVPFKSHEDDFCYDVVAVSEEEVAPNVWKYGTGLAFQFDDREIADSKLENVVLSIDFRPRSSVWKTGMVLSNSEGTIDQNYTGEVSAVFYHVMTGMPRYKVGDRIGQIKIGSTSEVVFNVVNELKATSRGDGAYGSTGK